ncbi:hypothetical protein [Paenibacillus sp. BJ-4]|nr:hypothetical protein [Paenibacillus sp. BJ-4]
MTKTSILAASVVGDPIRYTLSITNSGVDSVTDTIVIDTNSGRNLLCSR